MKTGRLGLLIHTLVLIRGVAPSGRSVCNTTPKTSKCSVGAGSSSLRCSSSSSSLLKVPIACKNLPHHFTSEKDRVCLSPDNNMADVVVGSDGRSGGIVVMKREYKCSMASPESLLIRGCTGCLAATLSDNFAHFVDLFPSGTRG